MTGECQQGVQVDVKVLRGHLVLCPSSIGPHVTHLTTKLNQDLKMPCIIYRFVYHRKAAAVFYKLS
jgi:hypothetical protein